VASISARPYFLATAASDGAIHVWRVDSAAAAVASATSTPSASPSASSPAAPAAAAPSAAAPSAAAVADYTANATAAATAAMDGMGVKELKVYIKLEGGSLAGLVEKSDLVAAAKNLAASTTAKMVKKFAATSMDDTGAESAGAPHPPAPAAVVGRCRSSLSNPL
jgi:hypothetical protein